MSKGNATENDTLNAIVRGVDPSWRANANRYIALHTADPGEGGSQTTNECAYGGYARVAVTAATGFTAASGGQLENADLIAFDECTSGSETIRYVSIGTALSGAGQILYSGALTANRDVSSGITPQFAAGALVAQED